MRIKKKQQLKKQQRALVQKYNVYEQLQTAYSDDVIFYTYMQQQMDAIDEEAEQIRRLLEGARN